MVCIFTGWGRLTADTTLRHLLRTTTQQVRSDVFIGAKEGSAQYLANYDIYFHPSDREAFSMSILEAVMAGLPVVASQSVADAMGSDLVAETFVAGEADSAVEALERVLAGFTSHVADGVRRRQLVADNYGIENTASSYISFFQTITSCGRVNEN
ncbi:glycosyltransferase [Kocuria sp. CNJ-770]|uniref:glycosyltransferase n=1 Tax=Kocuria sp. CNJ-770 TaxID=1904964 RepID=UPI00096A727A